MEQVKRKINQAIPRKRKELLSYRIQVLFSETEGKRLMQLAQGMPWEGNLSKLCRSLIITAIQNQGDVK